MHPAAIAAEAPDRPAIVMSGSGEVTTFQELDHRSNQIARAMRRRGLDRGGCVAILMENNARYLEVVWAAQRSGVHYAPINRHLGADEVAYIVNDCGATTLVGSAALPVMKDLAPDLMPNVRTRLVVGGDVDGWEPLEAAAAEEPVDPLEDECEGDFILYSSGTTGRPKGIIRPLTFQELGQGTPIVVPLLQSMGMVGGDVFLSPAPLYHAAPIGWCVSAHRLGATAVVMERFDAELALAAIQNHAVTFAQFVPTMFVRMLKLDAAVRRAYDNDSLRAVFHAAAPCPIDVKRQMIEWWGPKIYEFWSSSEGAGFTFVTSEQWLERPGTVGQSMLGTLHILDDDGNELGAGEVGQIWAEGTKPFEYHNDPEKTASVWNDRGWVTVGDIGYLDDEGYLFLTDRASHMIISGGVNIYPQEAENILTVHPKVLDVAVIGVPDEEMGEQVKAVVQPVDWGAAGPELADELIEFCRSKLAHYKCPRTVDFVEELPRLDTGKLYKRLLRDRYL